MSTSARYASHAVNNPLKQHAVFAAQGSQLWVRMAKRYAIAAAGCFLFAFIYAQFSHEVFSPFMTWMFAIPLVAGTALALMLRAVGAPVPARTTRQLWALAIATFTIASCLRGIFEIAGTGSVWLWVYVGVGALFALGAIAHGVLLR